VDDNRGGDSLAALESLARRAQFALSVWLGPGWNAGRFPG